MIRPGQLGGGGCTYGGITFHTEAFYVITNARHVRGLCTILPSTTMGFFVQLKY